jgi:histidinol-phosphate aminotransferase
MQRAAIPVGDYDVRDCTDFGARLRVHRNESPLPTPLHVIDAVRAIDGDLMRHYPVDMQRRFTKGLAKRLGVRACNIVVANGADELLLALGRAACDSGDNAMTVRPTFGMYARSVALSSAEVRALPYARRWKLDPVALISAADGRTRLVILGHPNNPTGDMLDAATLLTIAAALPQALIAVDEVYLSFHERSLVRYAGSPRNVVIIGSLSKVSALAGMRVGYAVADPTVARALRRSIAPYPLSAASLVAATAYVENIAATEDFESALAAQIDRSLSAILAAAAPFAFNVWRSSTNFALVDFGFDQAAFAKRLRRRGIAVRTFADPHLAGCVRFCALDDQGTNELVSALRDTLPAFTKQTLHRA